MNGVMTGAPSNHWVAGVDGCPGGWIAVLVDDSGLNAPRVELRAAFADIVDLPEQPLVIGVDMPI